MDELLPIVGNNKRIIDIITDTGEPSLVKIKANYNSKVSRAILLIGIKMMSEVIGSDLNERQLEFLAEFIEKEYYGYKISDLNVIAERINTRKSFEKVDIRTICSAITDYSYERDETAVMYQAQKNSKFKKDIISSERMLQIYDNLKKEAKKKKPTTKVPISKDK